MLVQNIKILDCTLRDGGYVNNWKFGCSSINKIIHGLIDSNIEYIELGYLRNNNSCADYSLYTFEDDLSDFNFKNKFCLMVDFRKIDIDKLYDNADKFKNLILRIAFKKTDFVAAIEFCKKLKDTNFNISINPMNTASYNEFEFEQLIYKVNLILPSSFVIVDTNGQMRQNEIIKFLKIINSILNPNIALGFHSHDNLALSLLNAKTLIDNISERELILDSCLYGMGRGAGNLKTEEICGYLNSDFEKSYDLKKMYTLIKDEILDVYNINSWGTNRFFEASANAFVHPNYASYMKNANFSSFEICKKIFNKIPTEFKDVYNEDIISRLCKEV